MTKGGGRSVGEGWEEERGVNLRNEAMLFDIFISMLLKKFSSYIFVHLIRKAEANEINNNVFYFEGFN